MGLQVMKNSELPLNQVLQGDCIEVLNSFPRSSIDLIFADPPYNLQLQRDLWRPNLTLVDAVDDIWDQFHGFESYDEFTRCWLGACRRVLKRDGTIWVIGSYHNIFRIGTIMQDMGFWFLNDVLWIKTNPMPNFRGVRFTNAHETLIWAGRQKGGRYTFNHQAMKSLNDDKQMRSDWLLQICNSPERIKLDGKKAHSTQKPESLLYRVILASSNPQDVVLDPFFGTGTTGAVAKKLYRNWIGIEKEAPYVQLASERIAAIFPEPFNKEVFDVRSKKKAAKRIPFGKLLENGYLLPGQSLYFNRDLQNPVKIKPDGMLRVDGMEGSIHKMARFLSDGKPCNGWECWYYKSENGELKQIDELRQKYRLEFPQEE